MNKRVLLVLTCLVLVCCMLFACNTEPEQIVLDQLSAQVKDAKSITANILVKTASGMEISGGTVVIDFETKQRSVTLKTPNTEFTADGDAWKTESSTADFDTNTVSFSWNVNDFSQISYDAQNNCCNGVIGAEVVKQLGLADIVSSVQGDVNVKLTVSGDISGDLKVTVAEISYLSSNDNTVVITLTT